MSVIEDAARSSDDVKECRVNSDAAAAQSNTQSRALVPVAQPIYRMHEGRVVRSAGRMLVGSPLPVPTREDIRNDTPVFFGHSSRRKSVSSGFVVVVTCLLAAGFAIGLTHYLSKNRKTLASDHTASHAARQRPAVPATSTPRSSGPQRESVVVVSHPSSLSVKDIAGTPGVPLGLSLAVANASPDEYSFLMIRGLPKNVTISAGFPMKDAWAVSLRDLDRLTLQAPADYAGTFKLEVLLVKGADQPPEIRQFTVSIGNGDSRQPRQTAAVAESQGTVPANATAGGTMSVEPTGAIPAAPPAATEPSARAASISSPVTRRIKLDEETSVLAQANHRLQNFDVAGARLLFEYLARRGSAKAALELGHTYDPAFFDSANIRGMKPEVEQARQWYAKATELGNEQAAGRLRALAQR